MARPAERNWKIEGRERDEWDGAALAQLVVELARSRVADRRASGKRSDARRTRKGTAA